MLVESLVQRKLGVKDHPMVKADEDVDGIRVLLAPRLYRRLISSGSFTGIYPQICCRSLKKEKVEKQS